MAIAQMHPSEYERPKTRFIVRIMYTSTKFYRGLQSVLGGGYTVRLRVGARVKTGAKLPCIVIATRVKSFTHNRVLNADRMTP